MKKQYLFSILLCLGLSATASAQHVNIQPTPVTQNSFTTISTANNVAEGARDFVDSMANDALGFIGDNSLSTEAKKKEFNRLLSKSFDMVTIGRFALGRYWRSSSKEQKQEYMSLFHKMIIEVYSQRFADYSGQSFKVKSFRADNEKDTLVSSVIIPASGPTIQVDWRVRYRDNKYRVIDVIVEGVSMSVTQRSDFSSVIQRGGGSIEALLDHLRKVSKG